MDKLVINVGLNKMTPAKYQFNDHAWLFAVSLSSLLYWFINISALLINTMHVSPLESHYLRQCMCIVEKYRNYTSMLNFQAAF